MKEMKTFLQYIFMKTIA